MKNCVDIQPLIDLDVFGFWIFASVCVFCWVIVKLNKGQGE